MSHHINGGIEAYHNFNAPLVQRLESLGEQRINDLDAGKVSLQVISHAPLVAEPKQCVAANDQLAEACREHPERFAGFAMLPM